MTTPAASSGATATPASDPSRWMEQNASILRGKTPLQIAFPGSHNAATYSFDLRNRVDPSGLGCIRFTYIDRATCYILNLSGFVRRWAENQLASMRDQLQAGCRYIDLDVCKLMGDRYSGDASFYTAHSVCAVRVTDVIEEILAFVASHAGEIVVVNLVTQCDRFRTEPEVTIEFAALVKRQFGDAVHPAALAMKTTYENILASGKRLLLLSSNDALVEASGGLIGSANVIAGTFVDTDDLATKQAGLYQQLQQYEPDNDSYQESDIRNDAILRYVFCCLGPCRRNRGNMALADEINPTLTTFVNGLTAEMRGKIGYITVDDFVNTDNVQAAIALNTERASAPSASGAGVANGASPSEQQSVPPNTSASTFNVEAGPSSVDASSSEQQSVLPDTSAITFTAEAGPSSVDAMIITQQPTATSVTPPPVGPIVTLSTISMSTV